MKLHPSRPVPPLSSFPSDPSLRSHASRAHLMNPFAWLLLWLTVLPLAYVMWHGMHPLHESYYQHQRNDVSLVQPPINISLPYCLTQWRSINKTQLIATINASLHHHYAIPRMDCPRALTSFRFYSAFHQPHFSEHFFVFVSTQLWQHEVFGPDSCLRFFSVSTEVDEFWHNYRYGKRTWVTQMINALQPDFGDFVVSSQYAHRQGLALVDDQADGVRNSLLHRWFFHPSDAVWLTSRLFNMDPCVYYGLAKDVLKRPLRAATLQRREFREMLNVPAVREVIQTVANPSGVDEFLFDELTMLEQARLMLDTDLLVTIHGAGETNVAFMRPCSIVLEVCPFGYCDAGVHQDTYFGSLALSADVIFYRWTEAKRNCVMSRDQYTGGGVLTGNRRRCWGIYEALPDDLAKGGEMCMPSKFCRACSRTTNVLVNTTMLAELLLVALRRRETCIRSHPLYNPV